MYRTIIACSLVSILSSCSYLKNASIQAEYTKIQETDPSLLNLKHMIERESYGLIGKTLDDQGLYAKASIAVAAFSDKYIDHELVDIMHNAGAGKHYGLNLPEGNYQVLGLADFNNDLFYSPDEVIGQYSISLNKDRYSEMVVGNVDIELTPKLSVAWDFSIPVVASIKSPNSLFYPKNTIRSLDDPIFSKEMSTLGMYAPAAFLEKSPIFFYAMEEDIGYKIPVIFVHGINGSPREFDTIIKLIDKEHYKPWFFYYPSGGNLGQMADFFYNIFLSGKIVSNNKRIPFVIIAHSMGGLIVREALNKVKINDESSKIVFVSMATPFGGHPATVKAEKSGLLVLPSWRDLNPNNSFIKNLYRNALPSNVDHQLIYAFADDREIKFGENTDGTVPLSSQLHSVAQEQSDHQHGLNATHTGILVDSNSTRYIVDLIHSVRTEYPDEHMMAMKRGGYNLPLDDQFTDMDKYILNTFGQYIVALLKEEIKPIDSFQQHLIDVVYHGKPAKYEGETAWLKFAESYPKFVNRLLEK